MIFKLLILIFSFEALSFDKDFKTVNDMVPLEFNLLFESLKISAKTPQEKIQLVGICKDLDTNLGFLKKEHVLFLMKSQVIKDVLEHRFQKTRSFDVNNFLLSKLQNDFEKKKKYLTPFSQWIWRGIMAELNHRKNLGLISDKGFRVQNFQDSKKASAERFSKYLNYLIPWIDSMDSLPPDQFNDLTKEVSWIILNRLNERSLLFKRFASTSTTEVKTTIFNIPSRLTELHPQDIKRIYNENSENLTIQEKAEKAKTEANQEVQNARPDDMSPLSDEVYKELNQKTP